VKPGYVLALVNRGIAYAKMEQYDRAIQNYDQALRLSPNDPDALYNRAQARRAKGEAAEGDADIAKATQSN
jgi:tetratricopeptide (TPR) repeat protein